MAQLSQPQQLTAISLYKSGLSAQQVAHELSVSLNAIFYILRRYEVPRRSSQESNRIRFENQGLSYCIKESLNEEEQALKLAATMLYWAEGYKIGRNVIDFANSDPAMVLIFARFLREICGVSEKKLRVSLYCYEGQDIEALHQFWSNTLHISRNQFIKPYIKAASNQGSRGPRMIHGLVHVRYYDTKLLTQILAWIDEYQQKCVGGGVVNRDWL